MNVHYLSKSVIVTESTNIHELIEEIFHTAELTGMVMTSCEIKGEVTYEPIETVITFSLANSYEDIHIHFESQETYLFNLISEGMDYLMRAIPKIESLATAFYQNHNDLVWGEFQKLIEALQWFNEFHLVWQQLHVIHGEEKARLDEHLTNLNKQLGNLLESLENQDYMLLGDLLTYEIVPIFTQLLKEYKHLLQTKPKS